MRRHRHREELTAVLVVRVTPTERAAWLAYVEAARTRPYRREITTSNLLRAATREYINHHPKANRDELLYA